MKDALEAIRGRFEKEPYAKLLGMRLREIGPGRAVVEMRYSEDMKNICDVVHGGAIFSLIDGAFEAAANSHGTIAVALNVSVSYICPAKAGDTLCAQAKEVSKSRRISNYEILVKNRDGGLIAVCQAMAYRKNDPLPFL